MYKGSGKSNIESPSFGLRRSFNIAVLGRR
jgi:hypothetical protein